VSVTPRWYAVGSTASGTKLVAPGPIGPGRSATGPIGPNRAQMDSGPLCSRPFRDVRHSAPSWIKKPLPLGGATANGTDAHAIA